MVRNRLCDLAFCLSLAVDAGSRNLVSMFKLSYKMSDTEFDDYHALAR